MTSTSQKEPIVVLRGVQKSYSEGGREHQVLSSVNMELTPGAIAVIIGRSGSGKSTLLNIIGAIDLPDAGSVRVAGTDIGGLSEQGRALYRRSTIGFVFQSFHLIPTLTARENILLPLTLNGIKKEAAESRVEELLRRVELPGKSNSYPEQLSGGEQQRIAIARAIAHKPPILLADEPTGNLDIDTAKSVLALLDEVVRETGTTLIMVTHSTEVTGMADDLFTFDHGILKQIPGAKLPNYV